MDHPIRGWNECLITYVLAAASPTHPIVPAAYHNGWTDSAVFRNGRSYTGIELPRAASCRAALFLALLLPRARPARPPRPLDRKSVAEGKIVSVRVNLGV